MLKLISSLWLFINSKGRVSTALKAMHTFFENLFNVKLSVKAFRLLRIRKKQRGATEHQLLMEKLECLMKTSKMYRNSDLTINDLASQVGTNRTYISLAINKFYKQNFATYINNYRFTEMKEYVKQNPLSTNAEVASKCGFGSVDSMKRTIKANTGLTMLECKRKILEGKEKILPLQ